MDDLNKECMLHFIELQTKPDFVKTTFKGAKSIQAAKSVYERSSDPTIHEYLQVCIKIDQEHGEFPWKGKKYHRECFIKFFQKVILHLSIFQCFKRGKFEYSEIICL